MAMTLSSPIGINRHYPPLSISTCLCSELRSALSRGEKKNKKDDYSLHLFQIHRCRCDGNAASPTFPQCLSLQTASLWGGRPHNASSLHRLCRGASGKPTLGVPQAVGSHLNEAHRINYQTLAPLWKRSCLENLISLPLLLYIYVGLLKSRHFQKIRSNYSLGTRNNASKSG